MPEDLWPDNIAETNLVTPVSILKEQGALLGEKTRQLVKGEVDTQTIGSMLVHSFAISAPTLSYRYELFTVSHGVNFYPLTIKYLKDTVQLKSEDDFRQKLKAILSSTHTVNVVHSILAQVRS